MHPPPPGDSARAVVLLSGGLDSATCLAIARDEGFACHCLSFDYGQKHRFELDASARVAKHFHAADHRVIRLDPAAFQGSALTSPDLPVPHSRNEAEMAADIPITYVPARNLVFLSMAVAYAETIAAASIFIGVNALDYSGYPDCRPQFVKAFQHAANLATKVGVEAEAQHSAPPALTVLTPLIERTKAQIITLGTTLGVDYALTHSCYDPAPDGRACGTCDACLLRAKGFRDAKLPDPTRYAHQ